MNTKSHPGEQDNLGSPAVVHADLPALPEVSIIIPKAALSMPEGINRMSVYTAGQMQAYALLAIAQERERCAKICIAMNDEHEISGCDGRECAAAIRKGTP